MSRFFAECRNWFDAYASGYLVTDDENPRLKYDHCGRVRELAREILDSLHLEARLDDLIECAALLHDVGRFEQYRRFHTFDDRRSMSHGRLGSDVLRASGLLRKLSARDAGVILGGVFLHNRKTVPASCIPELSQAVRVVRDADKLDIFPIMLAHFDPSKPRNDVVVLHLHDDPEAVSSSLLDALSRGALGNYSDMRFVNDFKLLLMSWVYDLNFPATRAILRRSGHMDRLATMLPDSGPVRVAIRRALDALNAD